MPSGVRPFATLRVTAQPGVILSGAKNLSGDVGRMARACPEQGEGMRHHILETVRASSVAHLRHGKLAEGQHQNGGIFAAVLSAEVVG